MSKKSKFKNLAFQVCGKSWRVYYCSTRYFNKRYGKGTLAIAECDDKEIFFRAKQLSYETAVHELMHAYFWESGMRSLDLKTHQLEELCCEIVSKHAREIILTAEGMVREAIAE